MSKKISKNGKQLKIGIYDIKRAYFNAPAAREKLYIHVPKELVPDGIDPRTVIGVLKKSMYGMRDSGANWEAEISRCFSEAGFRVGTACPNVYWNEKMDSIVVCHGDDVVCLGDEHAQNAMNDILRKNYEVKFRFKIGPEAGDDKKGTILNRTVELVDNQTLEIRADGRHAKEMIRAMNLTDAKGVSSPIEKEMFNENDEPKILGPEQARIFRSVTMRGSYLGLDRFDIQYTIKECAREMHQPTEKGWRRLKRQCRYLCQDSTSTCQ